MKNFIEYVLLCLFKLMLKVRYKIRVEGLDKLDPKTLSRPGGVLFLPNHPTFFVDPIITSLTVWRKFPVRPLIADFIYNMPVVNTIAKFIKAIPVPDYAVSNNSLKRKKGERAIQEVIDGLKRGEHFLVYPSGKAKHSAYEAIGGASGAHHIIHDAPEANIVLVRIKGLWGSCFSRAISDTSALSSQIWFVVKVILKNLIFFTPRRQLIVEFVEQPKKFPRDGSRLEINHALEEWYNVPDGLTKQRGEYPGDSLVLVSYSMWGEQYLPLRSSKQPQEKDISLTLVPQEVQFRVRKKLAELVEADPETIKPEMSLATDLGLDSLDVAELVAFLQDQYDIQGVQANELTTVAKLMAIASRQIECKVKLEDVKGKIDAWFKEIKHTQVYVAPGKTIAEVFLNQCAISKNGVACADARIGIQTYNQLKLRSILLAEYIRKLPGTYIGIMLPASVAANLLILACEIAGKVPLMVNWTVGPRHLESVVELSKVKVVITSSSFIDRLDNVDLTGVDEMLLMLEDVIKEISLFDKLRAAFRSKMSTKWILKTFGADKLNGDSPAVLLFTSGTESMPKGVPLSQNNILSNLRACTTAVEAYADDIIFSMLPPFHSFGFTVSGIFGLLCGLRVIYSPDPTDGKKLAREFGRYKATILFGAPTFVRGILKAATTEDLSALRLCVTGAEKAPPELFKTLEHFGKYNQLMEGYGITECSPVLTMNPPGSLSKGVGLPLPGIELKIVHPETEVPLPLGERGLILAKGPNIFNGYINPSVSSPFTMINGERWYKTGDLGFLDEKGFLTLSGRMKRFVKVGGEMVSLAAIEEALLQVGLKKGWGANQEGPSIAVCSKEVLGEKTRLFLFNTFDIEVDDVNTSLKDSGFSNLVRISSVIQLPELPVMGTGKINYRLLESEYLPSEKV